jgi:hypothetical protein
VQTLLAVAGPDLAAEQAQAHLDQPVVQVGEDDVVPVARDGVIEGDGANGVRVRVVETRLRTGLEVKPAPLVGSSRNEVGSRRIRR